MTVVSRQLLSIILLVICSFSCFAKSPVGKHGALSVINGKIVNQHQTAVSLAGPSLFWSWDNKEGDRYYHPDVVKHFAQDWNASVIRAAIAAQGQGSYLDSPERNLQKAETIIKAAIDNDLYVIVDWHSHIAEQHTEKAIEFFTTIAEKYGHYPNVIYELYNEPLKDTDWKTVIRPYAEQVISAIRNIDSDNIIIVGTQTWSQDVDKAADDPITITNNLAYALHFYAGTHKASLRQKAQYALDKGIALFVSEWGTVNANGDGDINKESTQQWLTFIKKNQLSHCSWSVTNKDENSAILLPTSTQLSFWPEHQLSDNGKYLKTIISQWGY